MEAAWIAWIAAYLDPEGQYMGLNASEDTGDLWPHDHPRIDVDKVKEIMCYQFEVGGASRDEIMAFWEEHKYG